MTIQASVNKLTTAVEELVEKAFDEGVVVGKEGAQFNPAQYMKQIAKMQRQIDECHDTIRRRNLKISELQAEAVKHGDKMRQMAHKITVLDCRLKECDGNYSARMSGR